MNLVLVRAGIRTADALLAAFYGLAPLEKVGLDPLTPRGFDRVVLGVLREVRAGVAGKEKKAIEALLRELEGKDWAKLGEAARDKAFRDAAEKYLGFGPDVGAAVGQVARHVGPTIIAGTKAAAVQRDRLRIEPSLNAVDERMVVAAATHQALFARDEHGRRSAYLSDRARAVVSQGLEEGLDRYEIAKRIRSDLGAAADVRSENYWRLIASVFTGRARSYGHLSAMGEAGIEEFEFEAVLDEVTTEICRFMHGKTFSTRAGLARFSQVESAPDPEEVKDLQPWASTGKADDGSKAIFYKAGGARSMIARVDESAVGRKDEVGRYSAGMRRGALEKAGLTTPPLHGHCRSTTLPVLGSANVLPGGPGPDALGAPLPAEAKPRAPAKPKKPELLGSVVAPLGGTLEFEVKKPPKKPGDLPEITFQGRKVDPATFGLSAAQLAALRDASHENKLLSWLAGTAGEARDEGVDWNDLEGALRALAKDGGLARVVEEYADLRYVSPGSGLGRVVLPNDLDRTKVATAVLSSQAVPSYMPTGKDDTSRAPVLVRYKGKIIAYDGAEQLVASRIRANHESYGYDGAYVRFVDLDRPRRKQPLGQPLTDVERKAVMGKVALAANNLSGGYTTREQQEDFRDAVRNVLRAHGVVPRDELIDRAYGGLRKTYLDDGSHQSWDKFGEDNTLRTLGAAGVHGWAGDVEIEPDTTRRLTRAMRELRTNPDFLKIYFPAKAKSWNAVTNDAEGLRVVVHEELHGASRISRSAYKGVGVGMEEAATEILARKITRELLGYTRDAGGDADDVPLGLPTVTGPGKYASRVSQAYEDYVGGLLAETAAVTGTKGLHARVEQALLATRQDPEKLVSWSTGEAQVRAYVDALALPKVDADKLYASLTGPASPLR